MLISLLDQRVAVAEQNDQMFRELRKYGALGDRIYSVTIEPSRSHQLA